MIAAQSIICFFKESEPQEQKLVLQRVSYVHRTSLYLYGMGFSRRLLESMTCKDVIKVLRAMSAEGGGMAEAAQYILDDFLLWFDAEDHAEKKAFSRVAPLFSFEKRMISMFEQARQEIQGGMGTNTPGRLPEFLVIGSPKCATTWLYSCLQHHKDVFLPQKEIEFFTDSLFHKGADWFSSFYSDAPDMALAGEFSVGPFGSPRAPGRVVKSYEGKELPKIVVLLRDPLERMKVYYNFRLRNSVIAPSLSSALSEVLYWQLFVEQSCYARYLQRFVDKVGKERILVLFQEDIRQDAQAQLDNVCDFLGLSKMPHPYVGEVNEDNTILLPRIYQKFQKLFNSGHYMSGPLGAGARLMGGAGRRMLIRPYSGVSDYELAQSESSEIMSKFEASAHCLQGMGYTPPKSWKERHSQ